MIRKLSLFAVVMILVGFSMIPVHAQEPGNPPIVSMGLHWLAVAMAISAAGCGYAQSKVVTAGCEGVARNPGAVDTVRFFVILGLAFIEFLALLTFVVILFLR